LIPIRDENPTETFPFVTIALIAINVAVFLWEISLPKPVLNAVIYTYGAIPLKITSFGKAPVIYSIHGMVIKSDVPVWITLFTCMFLHGGFFHLAGNMLYLWIFGNNVEDRLGHFRFLIFYLLCGIFATLIHSFVTPHSPVPMIGASGAISGVLGAYMIAFPWAKVETLVFFFFFITTVEVPAFIFIGVWFFMQYLNGVATLTARMPTGVAWFAHIGGFISGVVLYRLFPKRSSSSRKKVVYFID